MNMVDGVLLIVDAVDGPKPQTRFVLKKALEKGVRAIVVINKVDKPHARYSLFTFNDNLINVRLLRRPAVVLERVFDLFMDLNANEEQMDYQVVYASGLNGMAGLEPDKLDSNLQVLFEKIMELPKAKVDNEKPLQMMVANVDVDDYKGKMGIGRIMNGNVKAGDTVLFGKPGQTPKRGQVQEIFVFNNVGRDKVDSAFAGDIVMISGLPEISIGDTIMDKDAPEPLPPIIVEQPTVRMTLGVNKSPFAGREGQHVHSSAIRARLLKELDKNVALKIEEIPGSEAYELCGRGQLHLTVLIENMRREGFEMMVGPPTVIEKTIDGVRHEPYEIVDITVPDEYSGAVMDLMNKRKGKMQHMGACDGSEGQTQMEFLVPTRAMIGIRNLLLTETKGNVVMDTVFHSYQPTVGTINMRQLGSLLAHEEGVANSYGIESAQERGQLFVKPKDAVYKDMIVGIHQRPGDLSINVCKQKKLTNMRASGSDEMIKLTPPLELNLDVAVEYIAEDELVEVTPKSIRMTKHANFKEYQKKRRAMEEAREAV